MAFKLAIVDDEKITRESLATYVDWTSLDIELAFTAQDGAEALLLMEETNPNILLTDVRMPHMNGMELAMHVRSKHPLCRIVFLSGYTDKEYLKSAINLKVESYIEKPIDINELTSVMASVVSQLKSNNKAPGLSPLVLSNLSEISHLIKQEIAEELTTAQSGGYVTVRSRFYPMYFNWDEHSLFHVSCIHPNKYLTEANWLKDYVNRMYAFLENSCHSLDFLIAQIDQCNIALLFNNSSEEQIMKTMHAIQDAFQEQYDNPISIGLGKSCENITQIPQAWLQAKLTCLSWFYLGKGKILIQGTEDNLGYNRLDKSLFEHLEIDLENIEKLFSILKEQRYEDISEIQSRLYALYKAMMERTVNDNAVPFQQFKELTFDEVQELILYGMHAFKTLGNDQYDPKVKDTIHYILWHYMDNKLSINMLAEHAGITQNYLCAIFKQDTGMTINNVIIDVRMEKTKKLLRTTDLRLYEIAERVGIQDPNYLSILFKNNCTQTPSQYREAVRKRQI